MSMKNKRVLFVHQGAELYGSDRTFEQSVRGYRIQNPDAHISVLLAASGPLEELLRPSVDELVVEPLFCTEKAINQIGCTLQPCQPLSGHQPGEETDLGI